MDINIKKYRNEISEAQTDSDRNKLIIELKEYIKSLPINLQEEYRNYVIGNIEARFEIMDKLFEAYELMKKRALQYS